MYKDKKIFIVGLARSGYEVAKVLLNYTNNIVLVDENENDEHIKELESLGVKVIIADRTKQGDYLDESFDLVVKNPGAPLNVSSALKAEALNIPIINEVEVAYNLLPKDIKIIAVTGSNGKTTTTQIIYEILKSANLPVLLGGNIGTPVSALLKDVKEDSILVLEVSSHQLVNISQFKADISIFTNLSEVHLDFFGTYDRYINTKKRIFNNHDENNIAIINGINEDVVMITSDIPSQKITFGDENHNLYIKNEKIYYDEKEIIFVKDIKLSGRHNYENMMCAIAVAKEFDVDNDTIKNVLAEFGGVEHRQELVREYNGRFFYNDSKSTNVVSTITALDAFKMPISLLLGGVDRGHSFEKLKPHLENVERVLCYGEIKNKIKEFFDSLGIECLVFDNLEEATKEAFKLSRENSVILLSPACGSWDQYSSFEERGNEFKRVVNDLE